MTARVKITMDESILQGARPPLPGEYVELHVPAGSRIMALIFRVESIGCNYGHEQCEPSDLDGPMYRTFRSTGSNMLTLELIAGAKVEIKP